jgi:voltage-gated potassium channel Kch
MKNASLKDRIRYSFENTLSKGTIAIIGWLAVISILIIVIAATIIFLTGLDQPEGEGMNFFEAAWQSFLHTIDSGTVAGDNGWVLRILMLLVTIGGIFIVSSLIGTLTSGLESKMDDLRKGRSRVLEENHTLILGWSSKIYSIISELIIANENQKKPRIVILSDRDKVEMEDEIKIKFPNTKNTKIICRTGSPLDLTDLEVVNPNNARSIIILSPESSNPDTEVIKSILALTNSPTRKKEKYHIVAEIKNDENIEAAELVSNNEAVLVLSSDLIAKVTAQTCRQSGLSVVYTELLDFDGAEIYFKEETSLAGKTYKDALFAYRDSTVIGLYLANGNVLINPSMNSVIGNGDQVIAISMDDDTIKLQENSEKVVISDSIIRNKMPAESKKERTLVLGWNERGASIIKELDNYVAVNSEVKIISENPSGNYNFEELQKNLSNQKISFREGNINDRKTLDSIGIETFDHIIILCYEYLDIQLADAKTLIALLHLRNISEKCGKDFSIVSEMLDIKNRELAEVTKADDFIISDKLVSLMLSQLSENKELKKVFDQLFAAEGSEIYLKPISNYIKPNANTDFYTLLESASQKGETAIGYRIQSQSNDPGKAYGVVVNPDKANIINFTENDKLIVLAEN